ncbi:hypothetical protein [Pyruvatibacter mobilis]|uniref:hypothetical protein n=1 Tax=Pyruvatibacter mobilis TaxID=1712261 RepID=UPI003BAD7D0A
MVKALFSGAAGPLQRQPSVADLLKQRAATPSGTLTGAASAGRQDPADALLGALKKAGATNTEALEKKLAEDKEAKAGLDALRKQADPSEARKARARQKIEEIKKQLEALRVLAAVNPEAAARQAARLSRELATAVKEYASAGGDTSSLTGTEAPNIDDAGATAPADAQATRTATETATETTTSTDAATDVSAGTPDTAAADQTTGNDTPEAPGTEQQGEAAGTSGETSEETPGTEDTHPDRAGAEAYQSLAAEQQKSLDAAKSEDEFVNTIRQLKAELASLIKRGQDAQEDEAGAPRNGEENRRALRALEDVDQALLAISSPTSASLGAINIIA